MTHIIIRCILMAFLVANCTLSAAERVPAVDDLADEPISGRLGIYLSTKKGSSGLLDLGGVLEKLQVRVSSEEAFLIFDSMLQILNLTEVAGDPALLSGLSDCFLDLFISAVNDPEQSKHCYDMVKEDLHRVGFLSPMHIIGIALLGCKHASEREVCQKQLQYWLNMAQKCHDSSAAWYTVKLCLKIPNLGGRECADSFQRALAEMSHAAPRIKRPAVSSGVASSTEILEKIRPLMSTDDMRHVCRLMATSLKISLPNGQLRGFDDLFVLFFNSAVVDPKKFPDLLRYLEGSLRWEEAYRSTTTMPRFVSVALLWLKFPELEESARSFLKKWHSTIGDYLKGLKMAGALSAKEKITQQIQEGLVKLLRFGDGDAASATGGAGGGSTIDGTAFFFTGGKKRSDKFVATYSSVLASADSLINSETDMRTAVDWVLGMLTPAISIKDVIVIFESMTKSVSLPRTGGGGKLCGFDDAFVERFASTVVNSENFSALLSYVEEGLSGRAAYGSKIHTVRFAGVALLGCKFPELRELCMTHLKSWRSQVEGYIKHCEDKGVPRGSRVSPEQAAECLRKFLRLEEYLDLPTADSATGASTSGEDEDDSSKEAPLKKQCRQ